jgi:hypothetical protein
MGGCTRRKEKIREFWKLTPKIMIKIAKCIIL